MSAHVVLVLILGALALATCWFKGRQWPTFITATLFGVALGATPFGQGIMGIFRNMIHWLNSTLS